MAPDAPGISGSSSATPLFDGEHDQRQQQDDDSDVGLDELFVDPMLGTPLQIYVEKEVENRDEIARLIKVSINLDAICIHRLSIFGRNTVASLRLATVAFYISWVGVHAML
jgi:hypothetical protein